MSACSIAAIAFADPGATARLNAVMHPRIGAEAQRRIAAHPDATVVVYDMPLLVETGQREMVDVVVVVVEVVVVLVEAADTVDGELGDEHARTTRPRAMGRPRYTRIKLSLLHETGPTLRNP